MRKTTFGLFLMMEALVLAIVALCALGYHFSSGDNDWPSFALSSALTLLTGVCLYLSGRKEAQRKRVLTKSDSFIIVTFTWVLFAAFGALPFMLCPGVGLDAASAFFETMSGFTTMGGTVLSDVDSLPHGILLWRSLMQWMGGLGIIVFSFALLPVGELKNANVYQAETTGISLDRLRPKIGDTARRVLFFYFVFTLVCMLLYWAGPMDFFDALNYAMCTLSTGGFGTHSASIGYFHSRYIEYVCIVFMLLASVNFSLYYYALIRRARALYQNEELQTFGFMVLGSVAAFCLLFAFAPLHHHDTDALLPTTGGDIFRAALFHVSTIISSTGFQGEYYDYVGWGASFWMPTIVIMAIGSCAGSTAGGIKIVRVLIYLRSVINEFWLLIHPHAVLSVRINGQVVPESRQRRALVFIIIYMSLIIVGIMAFSLMGVDVDSAIGACITSLSNVGPGTGLYGPSSNFALVPSAGKWLLSFYMLVGRLELFTVLFLFMPRAWK